MTTQEVLARLNGLQPEAQVLVLATVPSDKRWQALQALDPLHRAQVRPIRRLRHGTNLHPQSPVSRRKMLNNPCLPDPIFNADIISHMPGVPQLLVLMSDSLRNEAKEVLGAAAWKEAIIATKSSPDLGAR